MWWLLVFHFNRKTLLGDEPKPQVAWKKNTEIHTWNALPKTKICPFLIRRAIRRLQRWNALNPQISEMCGFHWNVLIPAWNTQMRWNPLKSAGFSLKYIELGWNVVKIADFSLKCTYLVLKEARPFINWVLSRPWLYFKENFYPKRKTTYRNSNRSSWLIWH